MDLDSLIIRAYCLIDDELKAWLGGERLRQRGPEPVLADSEVLTMEAVGEYPGLDADKGLYAYFRRHYSEYFPALRRVHRTSFTRQAANLWKVKERIWQRLVGYTDHDPHFGIADSFPLPVCRFARAPRCKRFRADAAFGKDPVLKQTYWGLRVHARVAWPGVIARISVAPANAPELSVLGELTEGTSGFVLGDRNYWSPDTKAELAQRGVELIAPYRHKSRDPHPELSAYLSGLRYRIDTVFGQLTDRYSIKRLWARDWWHLANKLLRTALSHTLMFLLNQRAGNQPLQLARLLDV
jgi:hypothetical protein